MLDVHLHLRLKEIPLTPPPFYVALVTDILSAANPMELVFGDVHDKWTAGRMRDTQGDSSK